ncbi:GNAT family N-acetyltransferase [Dongshaea marina]|uniref:GNAT family N-acetyltransferase n=1 Tax=Dongshaea marina TaxID=2047966 RepID=UPI000D3EE015|nr:GNAT family N-acetyltransferase [Dongshaea marina]
MDIRPIQKDSLQILHNLAQAHEAEFSAITGKLPNQHGIFSLDTQLDEEHSGFLLFQQDIPVGFAVIGQAEGRHDIAEFYVIPSARKQGLGFEFASWLFDHHPGAWQVRQIQEADGGRCFWQKVIARYTDHDYSESRIKDPVWGDITRQIFSSQG